jgi:hypothetical protein
MNNLSVGLVVIFVTCGLGISLGSILYTFLK